MEKKLEILDLPDAVRVLVGECELTGRRTLFTRNARPVVALVSYDEYLALRETLDVANDEALRAQLAEGEKQSVILVEDLLETMKDER